MSFDKFHLMRDEEFQRLRQKQVQSYNPELRLLTRLDDDMNEILNDTTVPTDVKMRIFDHIKQRFKDVKASTTTVRTKILQPIEEIPEVEEFENEGEEASQADDEGEQEYEMPPPQKEKVRAMDAEVLEGIQASRQTKASGLLKKIQAHPEIISINDNNEIVLHGKTIRGSNYVDLFQSLYSHKVAQDTPDGNPGHSMFLKALNAINVPASLISSTAQYAKLVELKKTTPTRAEDFISPIDSPSKFALAKATPLSVKQGKPMKGSGVPPGKRQRMMTLYRI